MAKTGLSTSSSAKSSISARTLDYLRRPRTPARTRRQWFTKLVPSVAPTTTATETTQATREEPVDMAPVDKRRGLTRSTATGVDVDGDEDMTADAEDVEILADTDQAKATKAKVAGDEAKGSGDVDTTGNSPLGCARIRSTTAPSATVQATYRRASSRVTIGNFALARANLSMVDLLMKPDRRSQLQTRNIWLVW
jgi:hypothetical protein